MLTKPTTNDLLWEFMDEGKFDELTIKVNKANLPAVQAFWFNVYNNVRRHGNNTDRAVKVTTYAGPFIARVFSSRKVTL